jgi:hypothetical protein
VEISTLIIPGVDKHVTVPSMNDNDIGAIIEIGSNSVTLLIGKITANSVERIDSARKSVKVGQGAFQNRRLRPELIERVAAIVGAAWSNPQIVRGAAPCSNSAPGED